MTTPPTGGFKPVRKLIHLAGAGFPLLYLFTSRRVALIAALAGLVLMLIIEGARRRWPALERLFERLVGSLLRPGEQRRPTAGLWSMVAILVTVFIFAREIAIPAMLYAQLGDPAAEIAGRRWGRHRWSSGKSWEGSLACFLACLAIGLALTGVLPLSPGVAVLGALVATGIEAVRLPLGDNLWMAPAAAAVMAAAQWIGG